MNARYDNHGLSLTLQGDDFYYMRVCDKERACVQTFIKQVSSITLALALFGCILHKYCLLHHSLYLQAVEWMLDTCK